MQARIDVGCLSWSLFHYFFFIFIFWDIAFAMTLGLINLAKLTDSPKDPLAWPSSTGITGMYYYTKLFYTGFWDLNLLGPHACRVSTLQIKPSPQHKAG